MGVRVLLRYWKVLRLFRMKERVTGGIWHIGESDFLEFGEKDWESRIGGLILCDLLPRVLRKTALIESLLFIFRNLHSKTLILLGIENLFML